MLDFILQLNLFLVGYLLPTCLKLKRNSCKSLTDDELVLTRKLFLCIVNEFNCGNFLITVWLYSFSRAWDQNQIHWFVHLVNELEMLLIIIIIIYEYLYRIKHFNESSLLSTCVLLKIIHQNETYKIS